MAVGEVFGGWDANSGSEVGGVVGIVVVVAFDGARQSMVMGLSVVGGCFKPLLFFVCWYSFLIMNLRSIEGAFRRLDPLLCISTLLFLNILERLLLVTIASLPG